MNGTDVGTARTTGVQVIARAADVLRSLQGHPHGLSLSEIATRVGLARSTVHRLVAALEQEGFVVPASPNGRVRLGPMLARLAAASRGDLRDELHPALARLAAEVEETVDLAVLEGAGVRFLDQIPAPHRLRAVSAVGETFPAHCTANGKALLAALPRDQVERVLPRRLTPYTPNTIASRPALWTELDAVREAGVAYDREEHTLGVCAVGATIDDAVGSVAAITVVAPADRFAKSEKVLAEALLATCAEASRLLGGQVERD
jgi:DNA-binding IclR family transcriptional regulator